MIVWSFDSQLQLNCQQVYCSHETSFHFWMNRWKDIIRLRYRSMKSVKIKINRYTKRVCHRFLPIDRYNQYQSKRLGKVSNFTGGDAVFLPWEQIFVFWLLSRIKFCFKPRRKLNGSQETLLSSFLWLDVSSNKYRKLAFFNFSLSLRYPSRPLFSRAPAPCPPPPTRLMELN